MQDLKGRRFGRWIVLKPDSDKKDHCTCRCDCGTEKSVFRYDLLSGKSKSCGCLNRDIFLKMVTTHGKSYTSIYHVWNGMNERCYNHKSKSYKNYGGRGISVCPKWHSFEGFYEDVGDVPKGKTIDRIDNDGNYCLENLRFATPTEQNRNQRTYKNNILGIKGVKKRGGSFGARISVNKKSIWLGTFSTAEAAIEARTKAEERYWK